MNSQGCFKNKKNERGEKNMNELNTIWKEHKEQELFHQTKRREIEAIALAENKLDGFKVTKSYSKVWNQTELKNIEQAKGIPLHEYFELEYKPISEALKNAPEDIRRELEVALTIKENKPTFALKETQGE